MTDKRGTKLKDYKGYEIFVTEGGKFRAFYPESRQDDSPVMETSSLGTLQDKLKVAANKTVQDKKVLYHHTRYYGSDEGAIYEECVTIGVRVRSGRNEYKLQAEDGRVYEDVAAHYLYKPSPENQERIKKLAEIAKEQKALDKQEEKLKEALEQFTDEELLTPTESSG